MKRHATLKDYQKMKEDIPIHMWSAAQLLGYIDKLELAVIRKDNQIENLTNELKKGKAYALEYWVTDDMWKEMEK